MIELSGFKKFPPRLFYQPIFYPELCEKIARDWNTKDAASEKHLGAEAVKGWQDLFKGILEDNDAL